jgi:hypothetical protein
MDRFAERLQLGLENILFYSRTAVIHNDEDALIYDSRSNLLCAEGGRWARVPS